MGENNINRNRSSSTSSITSITSITSRTSSIDFSELQIYFIPIEKG